MVVVVIFAHALPCSPLCFADLIPPRRTSSSTWAVCGRTSCLKSSAHPHPGQASGPPAPPPPGALQPHPLARGRTSDQAPRGCHCRRLPLRGSRCSWHRLLSGRGCLSRGVVSINPQGGRILLRCVCICFVQGIAGYCIPFHFRTEVYVIFPTVLLLMKLHMLKVLLETLMRDCCRQRPVEIIHVLHVCCKRLSPHTPCTRCRLDDPLHPSLQCTPSPQVDEDESRSVLPPGIPDPSHDFLLLDTDSIPLNLHTSTLAEAFGGVAQANPSPAMADTDSCAIPGHGEVTLPEHDMVLRCEGSPFSGMDFNEAFRIASSSFARCVALSCCYCPCCCPLLLLPLL